jgi:hypothetical protein
MFRLALASTALLLTLQAAAQDLTVQPSFDGAKWLAPRERIELRLSRALTPADGRLAVMIGETDFTSMFDVTPASLVYRERAVPLPSGEREVVVSLVREGEAWQELGRFPIRVLTRRGFQKAALKPSVDLTNKGQLHQQQFPESTFSSREQFQDVMAQGGLATEHERGDFAIRTQTSVTGVSYVNEALRFGEKGERAPRVDLANYRVDLQKGSTQLSAGHVAFGAHRHLINGFGSRGVVLTLGASRPVSLSVGALSGTSVVGWDNITGLQNQEHRFLGASVGFELMPSKPGAVRLETSYLDGSLLPLSGYNQGAIRAAEKSRGAGVRLMLAHPSSRATVELGMTRSRFLPAADPQLEGGLDVVPLEERDRNASYADVSLVLLQNRKIFSTSQQANLALSVNYERIDPLFRTVAASLQSDNQRMAASLNGSAGPVLFQLGHARREDNLAGIRSILKTKTRETIGNLEIALAPLFGATASRWIPVLGGTVSHIHQFGAWLPIDAGFSDSHVPDQISLSGQGRVEWSVGKYRFGYRTSISNQDNRQIGRENADFRSDAGTVFVGFMPTDRLEFSVESSLERQRNLELDQRDRMRRHGATMSWRFWRDVALAASYSWTFGRDQAWTNERLAAESFVDLSSGFTLWPAAAQHNRARIFVRYSNRDSSTFDRVFDLRSDNEGWSITSGLNVSVF